MIAPEDENESEVRREDQDRINQFARLNARKQDVVFEQQQLKVNTIYMCVLLLLCFWLLLFFEYATIIFF